MAPRNPGIPSTLLGPAIEEAVYNVGDDSGAGVLSYIRDVLGFGISTQKFYQAWGTFKSALTSSAELAGLSGDSFPSSTEMTPWGTGTRDVYAYKVNLVERDILTGDMTIHPWTVLTGDLITKNQAIAQALSEADALDTYGEVTRIGGTVSSIWNQTGPRSA